MLTALLSAVLTTSAAEPALPPPPLLSVEGRAASLVSSEARLAEVEHELAALNAMPGGLRALQVIGLVATAAPLTYSP
ncbi:MAG: hypothetical protein JNJ54_10365 [Myxococcaceae bacterium]|nr:hypothetical protein [Myxococcaceae bacterium]